MVLKHSRKTSNIRLKIWTAEHTPIKIIICIGRTLKTGVRIKTQPAAVSWFPPNTVDIKMRMRPIPTVVEGVLRISVAADILYIYIYIL